MSELRAVYLAPERCPRCGGARLAPLDEDGTLGCIICGERVYPEPLTKQAPRLSPELVARIRERWGRRERQPITIRQLAAALSDLLGHEISESAVRHVLKERTWMGRAVAWMLAILTADLSSDGDCDLLQLGAWLVATLGRAS